MKKFIVFTVLLLSWVAAQAQWSVGVDARIAPWGQERKNAGTDIMVSYKIPVKSFYVMPSVGLFYKKYYEELDCDPSWYVKHGYQTGFDLTVVAGKSFGLGIGTLSVFTGPRYAYAYASRSHVFTDFIPNSFDWRIGVDYTFSKFTVSAKCDIATLKFQKDSDTPYHKAKYTEHQVPALAIGLAYNF